MNFGEVPSRWPRLTRRVDDANFMRPDSNDRGEMAADIAIRIIADARL
jgi:hypothetical protein